MTRPERLNERGPHDWMFFVFPFRFVQPCVKWHQCSGWVCTVSVLKNTLVVEVVGGAAPRNCEITLTLMTPTSLVYRLTAHWKPSLNSLKKVRFLPILFYFLVLYILFYAISEVDQTCSSTQTKFLPLKVNSRHILVGHFPRGREDLVYLCLLKCLL